MTDLETPAAGSGGDAPVIVRSRLGGRSALAIAAIVGILVAMLVVLLSTRDQATDRIGESRLIGQVAPPIAGETLDGDRIDIDDFRGRWVVVNFMASWCVPCRTEHPELVKFDRAHRGRGDAVLIGVTFDNQADDARAFFAQRGGDWPVINDPENSIGVAYGVLAPPETFLITPTGEVAWRIVGATTQADIEAVIRAFEQEAR